MNQTENTPTLSDIEDEARRLQAEHVAAFFRGLAARIRAAYAGAPMNTETGRTA